MVRGIRDKASQVKSLSIESVCPLPRHETDLVELLRSLRHLETIRLPVGCFSSNLARELQHHKNLKVVTHNLSVIQVVSGGEIQFPSPVPPLDPDAFPVLELLAFSTNTISEASSFITPTVFASNRLKHLWLHLTSHPQPQQFREFLDMLSKSCISLHSLTLYFFELKYDADDEEAFNGLPVLKYRDFLPLLRFKDLAYFAITHPHPIEMNDQDAAELASKWSHLVRLSLNPRPLIPSKTSLSLSAYVSFVTLCPSLSYIGLYIDATQPVPAEPDDLVYDNIEPGAVLDICVGRSPLSLDSDAPTTFYPKIARFLSTLLLPHSEWHWPRMTTEFYPAVEGPSTWLSEVADYPKVEEYEQAWKCIQGMTSLILSERLEARRLSEAYMKLQEKYRGSLEDKDGEDVTTVSCLEVPRINHSWVDILPWVIIGREVRDVGTCLSEWRRS